MKECSVCGECHERIGLGVCVAAVLTRNKEMELLLQGMVSAEYSDELTKRKAWIAASNFLTERK